MGDLAKTFWTGRSQAVRLPKENRFDGKEVRIHRDGDKVILEPLKENSWDWLTASLVRSIPMQQLLRSIDPAPRP